SRSWRGASVSGAATPPTVAVCWASTRSAQAISIPTQSGYTDLAKLTGGMPRPPDRIHPIQSRWAERGRLEARHLGRRGARQAMADYLLIESRDPFESNDVGYYCDLARGLVEAGNQVTLFLVQNGVLGG